MITVQELHIYPLKSARGVPCQSARLTATGLQWDRHWMLINSRGSFISQRTHPRMAQIQTQLTTAALILRIAGQEPLQLPLAAQGEVTTVQVWQDRCEGLDQGEAAAAWVSRALGEPLRAVRIPRHPRRMANPQFAGTVPAPVSFADGFPLLVCNRASLDDLNQRMSEPLPIGRFRPNIVLAGLPAFAEDRIRSICIGEVRLNLVKPCTRCVITATDQFSGERGANPLPVLREFRYSSELKGVTFGENAVPVSGIGASIERGASCEVSYE